MSENAALFLGAVAGYWWLWVVAAVLVVDQALRVMSGGYRDWTDRRFRPGLRAGLSIVAAVAVVLAAGYIPFERARAKLADTEKRLADAVVQQPQLKTLKTTAERLPDGSYRVSKLVEIVSRYPPGSLHIEAKAKGITGLKIVPQSKGGMTILGPSVQKGDSITDRIQGPVGKYLLVIHAASADVTIEHHFQ